MAGARAVAEANKSDTGGDGGAKALAKPRTPPPPIDFKSLWPIPALILAVGLFVAGLVVAVSSRPKPDPGVPLAEAERLVANQQFEEAIEYLNTGARPLVDSEFATDEHRVRFFLARARAFSGAQAKLGLSREENHRTILADFEAAEKLGAELDPSDIERLAETKLALDDVDGAWERTRKLPDAEGARKVRLMKQIVEHNLAHPGATRAAMSLELLAELSASPELPAADRAWVLLRQSEMLLAMGRAEDAVSKLLREIQRLRDVPSETLGELYLLLGKAYFETGQHATATRQLEVADSVLDPSSERRADTATLLGMILQAAGRLEAAKDKFVQVVQDYAMSPAYPAAVLGEAESEAGLSNHDLAVGKYAELVELVHKASSESRRPGGFAFGFGRDRVFQSLMDRQRERFESGELQLSLRYGQLAESMFAEPETPPALLDALARTHRRIADETVQSARTARGEDFTIASLDPATRAEVRQHYVAAGEFFRRHAQALAATDSAGSSASLWQSADSFDLSGDLEEARRGFATYGDGASDDDPRKPESRFRLAQIFQAKGEHAAAAALFRGLVDARAGVISDRSIVPLAQSLASLGDQSSREEAERQLLRVVDGTVLAPSAREYREALIELGGLYYVSGQFALAIPRLEQALERYPEDARRESVRFRLADSLRLEARSIDATLTQALPQAERDQLMEKRATHLASAVKLYDEVRSSLESKPEPSLTALERLQLRNATFYIGDCLFDLGDFDKAIAAYDAARLRYADDPASLVAIVQIVAAYVQQGKYPQARTANERARQQLARFPDEVWTRPELPMEKRHWERWLDARTLLEQQAGAAPAPAP
jgi:tetratricopeptide (TPR) repeat protein